MKLSAKNNPAEYQDDWNAFARDILGVRLDRKQRQILESVQLNRKTSVRSGHARGKDFLSAVASLCFLYLNYPSKVLNTAPSGRQVTAIMMSEISRIHRGARVPLGGEVQASMVKFENDSNWFLLAFKAGDKSHESWTGFHSPNIMVAVTEASGIEQDIFNAIEGVLTGTKSRLLIVFNPHSQTGESYNSTVQPGWSRFKLSCLDAPNVRARKILIQGQVDYEWVLDKIGKTGWSMKIDEQQADVVHYHDFKFAGQWYRPEDLFRVKVLGEFPLEAEDQLIPLSWIEAANRRWLDWKETGQQPESPLILGIDVAGMGNDTTVFCHRRAAIISHFDVFAKADHMVTVGRFGAIKAQYRMIDTIGEGAGCYSRAQELKIESTSAKFSEGCDYKDEMTNEREFVNMRSFCYWTLRDWLDPKFGKNLALPPDDMLTQELTAIHWEARSDGKIKLEPKDDIKKSIGRSPDKADSVALTFWPTELNSPRLRFI